MRLISLTSFMLFAFVTVGCVATGPSNYGPAANSKFGYSESKIEQNRYRVSYRGSGGDSADRVENLALRRAAELTLQEGYEWFRVVSRDLNGERRGGVSVGGGVGSGSIGRRSSVGVGVGGDFGRFGGSDFFVARLEILMFRGDKPQTDEETGNIYDAQSLLSNL